MNKSIALLQVVEAATNITPHFATASL